MDPLHFTIRLSDFDLSILPRGELGLRDNDEELREAVTKFFVSHFKGVGGQAQVVCEGDAVSIQWFPDSQSGPDALVDYSIDLLTQGDYRNAEPLLRTILSQYPDHAAVRLNYGMMLSDRGRLEEAVTHLGHASSLRPESADTWNALGVAHQRRGDKAAALLALQMSYELEPENPYTLRNLGALIAKDDPEQALKYLEKAAQLLPNDQPTDYGYALCLYQLGRLDEADSVLKNAIERQPYTELAETCRQLRTDIAQRNLRSSVGGGVRPDVVMYCLAALETAAKVGRDELQRITFEITMLGRDGLDINDPTQKYQLKSLPGRFSGLQMLSYMYVGFKQLDPNVDTGADFSQEYQAALKLFEAGK